MPILFTLIVLIPLFALIREYIKDSKEENVDTRSVQNPMTAPMANRRIHGDVLPIQWTYESSRFISSYMENREITFIDLSLSLNDLSFTVNFGKKDIKIDGIDYVANKKLYVYTNKSRIDSKYLCNFSLIYELDKSIVEDTLKIDKDIFLEKYKIIKNRNFYCYSSSELTDRIVQHIDLFDRSDDLIQTVDSYIPNINEYYERINNLKEDFKIIKNLVINIEDISDRYDYKMENGLITCVFEIPGIDFNKERMFLSEKSVELFKCIYELNSSLHILGKEYNVCIQYDNDKIEFNFLNNTPVPNNIEYVKNKSTRSTERLLTEREYFDVVLRNSMLLE